MFDKQEWIEILRFRLHKKLRNSRYNDIESYMIIARFLFIIIKFKKDNSDYLF